jgi:hypothetical protein
MGDGLRAVIGSHPNSFVIKDTDGHPIVVKFFRGWSTMGNDLVHSRVGNTYPAKGRIVLKGELIRPLAMNKWNAYWLVVDVY